MNRIIDDFEVSDGRLLGVWSANASSNHWISRELQSTFEATRIEWPALRNHILCMAPITKLAVGAFMSSLGVKCQTKSWEAHDRDRQFGENQSIDIRKSESLRTEGNARINEVSAMRPDLARVIEIVHISRYLTVLKLTFK